MEIEIGRPTCSTPYTLGLDGDRLDGYVSTPDGTVSVYGTTGWAHLSLIIDEHKYRVTVEDFKDVNHLRLIANSFARTVAKSAADAKIGSWNLAKGSTVGAFRGMSPLSIASHIDAALSAMSAWCARACRISHRTGRRPAASRAVSTRHRQGQAGPASGHDPRHGCRTRNPHRALHATGRDSASRCPGQAAACHRAACARRSVRSPRCATSCA